MASTHSQEDFSAMESARTAMTRSQSPSYEAAVALILLSRSQPVRSPAAPATRTPLPSRRPIPPPTTIISSYQSSSPSARADNEISVRTSNPPLFTFVVSRGYGVPLLKPGYKFYCAEHNKHIRNQSGWTPHQKEKHHKELSLKCPHCDNTFDQTYSLKRHDDNVHRKLRLYKCDACDITWQEKKDLVKHNAKHHPSQ